MCTNATVKPSAAQKIARAKINDFLPVRDLASWEDEDLNRYFLVGPHLYAVRDGCTGAWRGIISLAEQDVEEIKRR